MDRNQKSPVRTSETTRRTFLKTAALGLGAAAGGPCLVPASVFGANAPSNRIHIALIGGGNQSTVDLPAMLDQKDAQVVAVCDVNTASFGYKTAKQFLGRKPAQEKVDAFYAAQTRSGRFRGCGGYNDFREVLRRTDIDAVAVVVPDHWHCLITILAAEAGKDIYCEKPLSLTVRQGREMVNAVRRHNRILQTGSQYRSSPGTRLTCELVRNGRIGRLTRIVANFPENNVHDPGPGWQPMPVPEGFDYDLWLGPAPQAPYHKDRCLYRFRFNSDYSGGQVTNFGAHMIDIAQWAMGTDDTGPVELEDTGSQWPAKGGLFNTATRIGFRARYANGVELLCETREPSFNTRFQGTEGWLEYGYGGLKTEPASLAASVIGPNEIHLPRSNPARIEAAAKYFSPDHWRNFLDAVKSRRDPIEPVEVGHRTATICHLGNIVMQLKRKLRWDPAKEEFPGDDEANRMLDRPMRAPWRIEG
jgi:predicted dehydrogenase